jgi:tetratricopeptide (TPR) repeat protein
LIGIKEGDDPKEITLMDLEGKIVNVADYFGNKPVILVFWELSPDKSFLNYSLDELRFLKDYYDKHHDKDGLEIFGIYTPENDEDIPETEISAVRNLIEKNKIKYPILIDSRFKFFKEYGVIALPSTIMVDMTGKIKSIYASFSIAARPVISNQINELLGIAKVERKTATVKKREKDTKSHRFYRYALQMYKKNLLEQAFSSLKKSIDLNPNYALSHNLLGIILLKRGNFEGAANEFKRAIQLDDNNVSAYLNYTLLLIEQEDYGEAKKVLVKAPSSEGYFKARAHYLMGIIHKKTKKIDKALGEIEAAYSLIEGKTSGMVESAEPSYSFRVSILHELSILYGKKKNHKKALEMLHEAFHSALKIKGHIESEHLRQIKDAMLYN